MSQVSMVKDVAGTAEAVLGQAVEYCAQKMMIGSTEAVKDRIRLGDGQAWGYWGYSVARQVAECLGALDENIRAAYIYDYDATPEDTCFGEVEQAFPIHLLVWAERKTAALQAMVESWDRALARCYAEMIGGHQSVQPLDVQIVDSAEVQKRIGYGALLSSLHRPALQVWKR